jgi:hypothetical protein
MSDTAYALLDANDEFTNTAWFRQCRDAGTPYVVVRNGATSADVFWDFVTLAPACDALLREKHDDLAAAARTIFDRYATEASQLRIKTTRIAFDHLALEHAKSAATELHALIADQIVACAQAPSPVGTPTAMPWTRDPEPAQHSLWLETMTASSAA